MGFSSRRANRRYLFDSFYPADLSAGADVKETFSSLAPEGIWWGKSKIQSTGCVL